MGNNTSDVAGLTQAVSSPTREQARGQAVIADSMAEQFQRDGLQPQTPDAFGGWELT